MAPRKEFPGVEATGENDGAQGYTAADLVPYWSGSDVECLERWLRRVLWRLCVTRGPEDVPEEVAAYCDSPEHRNAHKPKRPQQATLHPERPTCGKNAPVIRTGWGGSPTR